MKLPTNRMYMPVKSVIATMDPRWELAHDVMDYRFFRHRRNYVNPYMHRFYLKRKFSQRRSTKYFTFSGPTYWNSRVALFDNPMEVGFLDDLDCRVRNFNQRIAAPSTKKGAGTIYDQRFWDEKTFLLELGFYCYVDRRPVIWNIGNTFNGPVWLEQPYFTDTHYGFYKAHVVRQQKWLNYDLMMISWGWEDDFWHDLWSDPLFGEVMEDPFFGESIGQRLFKPLDEWCNRWYLPAWHWFWRQVENAVLENAFFERGWRDPFNDELLLEDLFDEYYYDFWELSAERFLYRISFHHTGVDVIHRHKSSLIDLPVTSVPRRVYSQQAYYNLVLKPRHPRAVYPHASGACYFPRPVPQNPDLDASLSFVLDALDRSTYILNEFYLNLELGEVDWVSWPPSTYRSGYLRESLRVRALWFHSLNVIRASQVADLTDYYKLFFNLFLTTPLQPPFPTVQPLLTDTLFVTPVDSALPCKGGRPYLRPSDVTKLLKGPFYHRCEYTKYRVRRIIAWDESRRARKLRRALTSILFKHEDRRGHNNYLRQLQAVERRYGMRIRFQYNLNTCPYTVQAEQYHPLLHPDLPLLGEPNPLQTSRFVNPHRAQKWESMVKLLVLIEHIRVDLRIPRLRRIERLAALEMYFFYLASYQHPDDWLYNPVDPWHVFMERYWSWFGLFPILTWHLLLWCLCCPIEVPLPQPGVEVLNEFLIVHPTGNSWEWDCYNRWLVDNGWEFETLGAWEFSGYMTDLWSWLDTWFCCGFEELLEWISQELVTIEWVTAPVLQEPEHLYNSVTCWQVAQVWGDIDTITDVWLWSWVDPCDFII